MKNTILALVFLLMFAICPAAQIPLMTAVQIAKAEDSRSYDSVLENLMKSPNANIRSRAALAAGRIGSEAAVPVLVELFETDLSTMVRATAVFALGEIESVKGADAILRILGAPEIPDQVRARAVEAAGKISAANPKEQRSTALGNAILSVLNTEYSRAKIQDTPTIILALTAALRAKPEGGDAVVAKYLTNFDVRVRADAANTLTRLRAKNANEDLRKMLTGDSDAVARANAARALGAAEDKEALELLLTAATTDADSRVRVSAIRSLGGLRDAGAAEKLLDRGEALLDAYKKNMRPGVIPKEQNEFVEVAATLGRILANTRNERAVSLFREFGKIDKGVTSEVYVARIRVAPGKGDDGAKPDMNGWRQVSTLAHIVGELAANEPLDDDGKKFKSEAPDVFRRLAKAYAEADPAVEGKGMMAAPDVLQAFARFKTADLDEILRSALNNKDVQTRAMAAGLLAEQPVSMENVRALSSAFVRALLMDKHDNDGQLAILDALFKLDKKESVGTLLIALSSQDYLVRKKAFELLDDKELQKDFPGIPTSLENARSKHKDQVLPYSPVFGTKLGQVLNTGADYRRALSRKNGSVKAVLTTEKGTFSIDFYPEEAPLTVDNFVKLARAGYFNGLEVHRVVPNFVMQDGDPRGDGNGGPGWSIRCEINMLPYDRGAVGMALSGKDTGGSQWFVAHSPQPHLDGGYTVFGKVNETGMKVVDSIVRGDKILSLKIIDGSLPQRTRSRD
jgi:cyclophilin family peptidyl-prolyl cis-trans isomerase/HEAT repeat protein